MSRLELTLWAATMIALGLAATAQAAPPCPAGLPLQETYALSIELSNEAAAMTYEVDQLLGRCKHRKDVLDELRDLGDELRDLNKSLEEASYNPRRWNRVRKRTDDVLEEVEELDEEIHEAIDDLNRDRPRHTVLPPRGPSFYNSGFPAAEVRTGGVTFALRIGSQRGPRLVAFPEQTNSLGQPLSRPYRGAPQGYARLRVGTELEERVHRMLDIASQLDRLANIR